ncbi:CHC2 zinc finger domain-containing protein [Streptacidiphilus sp. N1-3]|uniref:CHC2 zinc finger domain-containing protein n=1 Tax=Streptacidiphilus alkalitolerans TaxID=3342712 RepID=A0ABV6XDI9_9ACTN
MPMTAITDIVARYVELSPAGGGLQRGRCPFHDDTSDEGDLYVSGDKSVFTCFGCQASGDQLTFIMRAEDVDVDAARRLVGQ